MGSDSRRTDRVGTCTGRSTARSLDKAPNSRSAALLHEPPARGPCSSTCLDCRASNGRVGRLGGYRSSLRPRTKGRLCGHAEYRELVICCNGRGPAAVSGSPAAILNCPEPVGHGRNGGTSSSERRNVTENNRRRLETAKKRRQFLRTVNSTDARLAPDLERASGTDRANCRREPRHRPSPNSPPGRAATTCSSADVKPASPTSAFRQCCLHAAPDRSPTNKSSISADPRIQDRIASRNATPGLSRTTEKGKSRMPQRSGCLGLQKRINPKSRRGQDV